MTEIEELRIKVRSMSDAGLALEYRFAKALSLSERYSEAKAARDRVEVYLAEMGFRVATEYDKRYGG